MNGWELITIGGVVGFLSAFLVNLYNNHKADKRLKKQLEQTSKNLYLQLIYADRKNVLEGLYHKIGEMETISDAQQIMKLIYGIEGIFIPEDVKRDLILKLNKFIDWVYESDPSQRYLDEALDAQYEEILEEKERRLDPIEKFEEDYHWKLEQIKNLTQTLVASAIRGEKL